jgi:raffinose/stachyose/melibiose transport system substrate-binding protein
MQIEGGASMKRFYLALALLGLSVGLLFANGTTEQAGSTAKQPVIEDWVDTTGNTAQALQVIHLAYDSFNQMNKGFTVKAVQKPNAWDAIRTAVAGGGGPDIVYTPGPSFVFEMAQAGRLAPLDQYAAKLGWNKQFLPWSLSLGKVNGKLYSIPHEIETMVLYYNKTVFQQHGWTPPKTMAEWTDLMQKVKAAGLIANAAGNADWRPADEHYVTVFMNAVAGPEKVYQALKGQISWTDPVFVKSIDMLNNLMENGFWQGGLSKYYTTKSNQFLADLGSGKAAMMVSGTWWMGTVGDYFGQKAGNKNEWDWVPVPTVAGVPSNFPLGIGSTRSINANSKYKEQAAEFLTYFFSRKTQSMLMTKAGTEPPPIQISSSDLAGLDPRYARYVSELSQATAAGNYGYTTWTFWPPKSDAYIYDEIEKVWAKQETTAQYLQGLQSQYTAELKAGSSPPLPTRQ